MTENEALEILNNECEDISKVQIALKVAREALEEIQRYREIGMSLEVVEELKRMNKENDNEILGVVNVFNELGRYRAIGTVEELRSCKHVLHMAEVALKHIEKEEAEIKALGGIEEFKALKEKATPKKVKGISLTHEGRVGNCPACGRLVRHQEQTVYCSCEQKLEWSE